MSEPTGKRPVEKRKPAMQASPPTRRYRAFLFQILLFVVLGAFSFLTILVETRPFFPIDLRITRTIQSIDSLLFAKQMWLVSWRGFSPQSIIIALLIGLLLYLYGLRWESLIALLGALISGVTNKLVKAVIQRPRPTVNLVDVFEVLKSYSFPSGHVMFYTIVFGFLSYLVYTMLKRSLLRSLLLGILGVLILLVGVSRIYLGQHWASDVLGAYLLGALILSGIILLHRWGKSRFFLGQPAAADKSSKE